MSTRSEGNKGYVYGMYGGWRSNLLLFFFSGAGAAVAGAAAAATAAEVG
jgi:hypothetical protein